VFIVVTNEIDVCSL